LLSKFLLSFCYVFDAINKSSVEHKTSHYRYSGRGPKSAADWRPGMAEIKITKSCDVFSELWKLKAICLEKLGRKEEADSFRKLAESPFQPDNESSYTIFHNKLKALRK